MTFTDEKDGRRRKPDCTANEPIEHHAPPARARKRRLPTTEVGEALKTAYQRTINEDVPPEMLDLLGKLG